MRQLRNEFCRSPRRGKGRMILDEKADRKTRCPAVSEDHLNGKIEGQDEDESRIELLQWYLKMALESEDDPKIKK
jgi:hypothetical protein